MTRKLGETGESTKPGPMVKTKAEPPATPEARQRRAAAIAPLPEEEAYFFAFLFRAVFEKPSRLSSRRHCQKRAILKIGIAGAGSSIVLI